MTSGLQPTIVRLEPMRVAACRATGREPELEAFRLISTWAREAGLSGTAGARYFGFDNPGPSPERDEYGYEVWMTIGSEAVESDTVEVKEFPGGLYAVMRTSLPRIVRSWKELMAWRQTSGYREAAYQCLEEHHALPLDTPPKEVEIDLYLPIAE
jgi:DNA gyrase inhibitor GyrI